MAPATHPLAQGLCADLARAYAFATSAVARARPAWLPRLPDRGGQHPILSALVHPWFYVLAGIDLARGSLLAQPEALFGWPFWLLAWFDLVTGYLASMAVGFLSARGRGYRHLMKDVPLMPALLAVDLGRRLPRALAIHDRALRMGEDRARRGRASGAPRTMILGLEFPALVDTAEIAAPIYRTTFRYRCHVACPSTGMTTIRPRNAGIDPITRLPAMIKPQIAIGPGLLPPPD